jgi:hypothetical protein
MNKKLMKTMTAGVLILALFFAGFSGLKAVFAQTTTPETPTTTETPATPSTTGTQVLPGKGNQGTSDDSLAAALGKTAAEMQAARKAVYEKAIDQALADGALTQAQATLLKANSGNGWGMLSMMIGAEEAAKLDEQALFAEALGITLDELNAAYAKVRTDQLAQLVTDGRLTQAQADEMAARAALGQSTTFQAEVKAGIETAINNAVKAGIITQAQADALIAKLQSAKGWGMGFGNFGGMHDGMFNGKGDRGQGMFGQGGQGRFNEKDFKGQGMFGQGGRGMNGQGGQGMNGNCDGTYQYAPTPTVDGTNG